jgi:nitrite reductase (NO-forming)
LTVTLAGLAVVLLGSPTWTDAGQRMAALTPGLAVGWIAQTLLGALGYLVPVLIGGGPRTVRAMVAALDRTAAARVTTLNAALAVAVLPTPSPVRVSCNGLVLVVLLSHLWLLIRAALTGRALRRGRPPTPGAGEPLETAAGVHRLAGAAGGLATVVLAVAVGAAVAPAGLPVPGDGPTTVRVAPTGHTTTVAVQAREMRFSPARIDVPAGDRLVIVVHNADDDRHDLVLSTGARTPRIPAGQTRTLDAGVIGGDVDGWCSVVGHRQMGMTLAVHAVGTTAAGGSRAMTGMAHPPDATFDPMAVPGAGFTARDARLEPLPAAMTPQLQRRTITVREVDREVAPGIRQRAWTFDGTVPGPVLHGRVGDTFEITLVNAGSMGHSIDFHAGTLAPAAVMRTIQPGESLLYRFTATRSGIWMYHCSTMPMSLHIANGMFGAVVIDPPDLAPAARQYVLLQSEDYLGTPGGIADTAKLRTVQPDAVVFNGYPNQYLAQPLTATVGERVRIWVLAAGPNLGTSFHVVGGQFDTLCTEGAYRLRPDDPAAGGAQVLDLGPAAGGFVELTFRQPGNYPFVSHRMVDAERDARGAFTVSSPTPPAAPQSPRSTPEGSADR